MTHPLVTAASRRLAERSDDRPIRIQLSRAKGWRMPEGTVVVSRPSQWGNPFKASDHGSGAHAQAIAVKLFECWLMEPKQAPLVAAIKRDLRGKNLACWCRIGTPCHASVLMEIANA